MSRRKAGCVPRRVELEPDQDDMEIPELIIDVKPEREAGALALEPRSPKDVSMPGLGTERRLDTAPSPFGTRSLWAPWIPLNPEPSGESPLLVPARIVTLGWVPLARDRPGVPSPRPCVPRDPRVGASPLGIAPGRPGLPGLRL